MRVLLTVSALVAATTMSGSGGEHLKIAVTPIHSIAPARAKIRLSVEPSIDNRALRVVADSGEFYRRSDVQLDGGRAPATITVEFPSLPGGDYEVMGVLVDSAGRERATARAAMTVVSRRGPDTSR
jgi:hypothetical protein